MWWDVSPSSKVFGQRSNAMQHYLWVRRYCKMYSWQISKEFMLAIHFEILIYIKLYGTATFCILYSQAATSVIIVCSQNDRTRYCWKISSRALRFHVVSICLKFFKLLNSYWKATIIPILSWFTTDMILSQNVMVCFH